MATFKRIGDADYAHLQTLGAIFHRLVFSHYNSSGCAASDLDRLEDFYKRYSGQPPRLNRACATCIGTFLTEIGRWYFKEAELRAREEAARRLEEMADAKIKAATEAPAPKKAANGPKTAAKKKSK